MLHIHPFNDEFNMLTYREDIEILLNKKNESVATIYAHSLLCQQLWLNINSICYYFRFVKK